MLLAVTLIGNPERALTENDVELASGAARKVGGSINGKEWLFPNEACDIFVEGDAELTRDALTPWSIENKLDVIVQPYQGRRKKAFLADMESTIIKNEMLDELAEKVGIGEQVALITRRSMEGEIDFKAVHAALADIGYKGSATVELNGGDAAYLKDVNQRFEKILSGA